MSVTPEEVEHIAELARLEVTAAERERFATTISAVLDYMKILNEVPTDAVAPTYQVTGLSDVLRDDLPVQSDRVAGLQAALPQRELDELVVPAVFGSPAE